MSIPTAIVVIGGTIMWAVMLWFLFWPRHDNRRDQDY